LNESTGEINGIRQQGHSRRESRSRSGTRYLPSGDAVANIRLATTDRFKDKTSGEMKELTNGIRVSFFGRLARDRHEYLKKGSSVYIEGPDPYAQVHRSSRRGKVCDRDPSRNRCRCWVDAAVAGAGGGGDEGYSRAPAERSSGGGASRAAQRRAGVPAGGKRGWCKPSSAPAAVAASTKWTTISVLGAGAAAVLVDCDAA